MLAAIAVTIASLEILLIRFALFRLDEGVARKCIDLNQHGAFPVDARLTQVVSPRYAARCVCWYGVRAILGEKSRTSAGGLWGINALALPPLSCSLP
jgi:hypothetical protein